MKAIIYTRVSTDKQAFSGLGLAAQRERCEAYAGLYDFTVVEVIADEGESAKTLDRPGLTRALAMLRDGEADALIVSSIDRLTRSVADFERLIDDHFGCGGSALVSVSEPFRASTATGRLSLRALVAMSQWEREAMGARTKAAMQHKRARLEYTGGRVRYGYRVAEDGRSLVEDETEQRVIEACKAYRAEGLSLRAISARLDDAGFRSRTGRPLSAVTISRIVREDAAPWPVKPCPAEVSR